MYSAITTTTKIKTKGTGKKIGKYFHKWIGVDKSNRAKYGILIKQMHTTQIIMRANRSEAYKDCSK